MIIRFEFTKAELDEIKREHLEYMNKYRDCYEQEEIDEECLLTHKDLARNAFWNALENPYDIANSAIIFIDGEKVDVEE